MLLGENTDIWKVMNKIIVADRDPDLGKQPFDCGVDQHQKPRTGRRFHVQVLASRNEFL